MAAQMDRRKSQLRAPASRRQLAKPFAIRNSSRMPTGLKRRFAEGSPGTARVRFSALLFTAFLIAAFGINYPGRMNEDSLWQFIGWANPEQMNDLHSPFVTWMWSLPAPLL